MRKLAHYYYSDGNEIVVSSEDSRLHIRDQNGEYPFDPVHKMRAPHPSENMCDEFSYTELGLYYGYEMQDTGW